MQQLRDGSNGLISRKIEQTSTLVFGPRQARTLLTSLGDCSHQPESCGASPNYMRPPIRMALQQLAYRFLLSPPSTFVPLAQDLFVLRTPNRTAIARPLRRTLELPNAPPEICSL